ncbi:hypothetical protein GCM10010885_15480 [Alicyclobacillus cellulosilyticus]|uniref:Uncharacterized protein n=1 Tax=Alicyclobacillus cellulosilyticus TaxID=1003997 RepID=A0A917KBQ5_9BACL|nr:hypothetical protein [Alicyclobacillus cellulosilyticus]GGJ07242.1 hypothetical protein GCM10010885_15480 [Alicyclobacillus cellulosilyticus]
MVRTSYMAEKLAVSFPLVVAVMGFTGWLVRTVTHASVQRGQQDER